MNDKKAKERMKVEFDRRMRTTERSIGVGSLVLLKRPQISKEISRWDTDPCRMTSVKGSLITAAREFPKYHVVVRNWSFFKLYRFEIEEEEIVEFHSF